MKRDIVIPMALGVMGSRHDDLELRYCLRAIDRFVADAGTIYLLGSKPAWVSSIVEHVLLTDLPGGHWKQRNIFNKIKYAYEHISTLSQEFHFFNDDHFLLAPWEAPYHHKGLLMESLIGRTETDSYAITLQNTRSLKIGIKDFDTHCPIVYNKKLFLDTVGTLDWRRPHGYGIKTAYCLMNNIEGVRYADYKLKSPHFPLSGLRILLRNRLYFSVDDVGFTPAVQQYLQEIFPEPSRYEIRH